MARQKSLCSPANYFSRVLFKKKVSGRLSSGKSSRASTVGAGLAEFHTEPGTFC